MKALIDADIFQWEYGTGEDSEGNVIPWNFVRMRIESKIETILNAVNATEYQLYLTSDDKSNFRYNLATIKPYKGNRSGTEKPRYYNEIRNYLKDQRGAIEIHGMEADDAIAIEQYRDYSRAVTLYGMYIEDDPIEEELLGTLDEYLEDSLETVICSRDKDLRMVPGYHYSWSAGKNHKEKELYYVSEIEGLRNFYGQMLTGDTVDNIPGLFGVGKSSSLLTHLTTLDSDWDMYSFVLSHYSKRFGSYAGQFLLENARLLWMLKEEKVMWEPPKEPKNEESIRTNIS